MKFSKSIKIPMQTPDGKEINYHMVEVGVEDASSLKDCDKEILEHLKQKGYKISPSLMMLLEP